VCQYPLDNNINVPINLPPAWSTLEDDFFLHEGEFLLSNNQLFQLYLTKGNLVIISVIINNYFFRKLFDI
jgi:hypothetical protein